MAYPWAFSAVAIVGSSARRPMSAPGKPTFVRPVRYGFWPVMNGGEAPVFYSFFFLYVAAVGPGPWSVDAMRAGGKSAS